MNTAGNKSNEKTIWTLDELKDRHIGPVGTKRRDNYERELADILIGYKIRDARINLDITQAELAERVHKKRSFISRVENNGGNFTVRTLREIVEVGLGGKLKIDIQF
jgi:putative DNA-binding protein